MLVLVQGLVIVVLIGIGWQDMASRSVYWLWFPLLAAAFIALHVAQQQDWLIVSAINLAFVAFQLLMVSVWFSWRQRAWVNITRSLLGWGDILFLVCLACCFSTGNFILFYVLSLLAILLSWVLIGRSKNWSDQHIPLAGLQALLLTGVLVVCWTGRYDTASDAWILQYLRP